MKHLPFTGREIALLVNLNFQSKRQPSVVVTQLRVFVYKFSICFFVFST